MLQNMRDGAQRWIAWIIIIFIIIAMTLWGISSYFGGGSDNSPAVAKVNNVKITQVQLNASMSRLRVQQPQLFAAPDSAAKIKQELLNQLVNQQILAQGAEREKFDVNTEQLDSVIAQIPAFQNNQQFSQTQFSVVLNRLMYTPEQFMADLRSMMLINQVRNGIMSSSFVLPNEISTFVSYLKQQRNIGYLVIPTTRFNNQIKPTDVQINSYYQQHQDAYMTPEQVSISYLELTPQMLSQQINPTPLQLQTYYQSNIANYSTPASWHVAQIVLNVPANATAEQIAALQKKLHDIRQQAAQGVSFAELAKKYSDDVMSSENGGELPWFVAGSLDPVFEKTVVNLKPGDISQPVQTQYGLELIKLLAVRTQSTKPFTDVKKQVEQTYISQQLQTMMATKNEMLANATFENPNTLQPAAQQLNLTIQTTPLFTRGGATTGILANANIVNAAFTESVLQQANNSDVLTLKDGTLVVIRVDKHIPAAVKSLQTVRPSIEQHLIVLGAQDLARQLGEKILQQLKTSDVSPSTLAATYQLKWLTKNAVIRAAAGINSEILQQAFNIPAPQAAQKMNVAGVVLSNGDYAVVGVNKAINAVFDSIPLNQRQTYQKQVSDLFAQSTYANYIQVQKDQSTIKYNP